MPQTTSYIKCSNYYKPPTPNKMSHIQGLSIVLLVVIVVATHFTVGKTLEYPNPIHHLRPHPGSGGHRIHNVNCLSWRFAIEANNIQTWKTVPKKCEDYVGHYMLGAQYKEDCSIVANAAISYVKGLNISKGKDIWVFDIDETSLSNLPYHARPSVGFGALPYNETGFNKWQEQASAPAIQSVLNLYNTLIQIGVKVVFLSGSSDVFREPKSRNMINIGYHTWFKMILK
ncbi:hypothetical protein RND81_14G153900 [Saponaria officinalis]